MFLWYPKNRIYRLVYVHHWSISCLYVVYEMNFSTENKKISSSFVYDILYFLWAFFEQSGGSLSIFANNLQFYTCIPLDPNGVNNSVKLIIRYYFCYPLGLLCIWLANRKAEPNTIVKFGLDLSFGDWFFIFLHQ